jgi:hypothetical protein
MKRDTDILIKLILIAILVALLGVIIAVGDDISEISPSASPTVALQTLLPELPKKTLKDTPILFPEVDYVVYYDSDPTKELLDKVQRSILALEEGIASEDYNKKATRTMNKELTRLQVIERKVSSDLEHYRTWEKEYYWAAKVWEYLRQRGFSQEVTCAIIGNMMIETSGGTLALNPTIYSPSGNYYGLCQWSLKYCPDAKDLPFEHQLDYLVGTMPWEFNTFGWLYKDGFTYEDFLKMKDPSNAALAFAMSYERCGPASYEMRQEAAEKAYNYFSLAD